MANIDSYCFEKSKHITYEKTNKALRMGSGLVGHIPGMSRLMALFSRRVSIPKIIIPKYIRKNISKQKLKGLGYWLIPNGISDKSRFIFYIHGGAYEMGNPETHALFLYYLAYRTKMPIFAPSYVSDKGIDVMHNRLRNAFQVVRNNYEELPILMGDSAGGGLVITFIDYMRKLKMGTITEKIVLISPWVDLDFSDESDIPYNKKNESLDFLPFKMVKRFAKRMCPTIQECSASAHLLLQKHDFELPTTFVLVGQDEVLNESIMHNFKNRNNLKMKVYDGMKHVFPVLGGLYNGTASKSITDMSVFLRNDYLHMNAVVSEVKLNFNIMYANITLYIISTSDTFEHKFDNSHTCMHKFSIHNKTETNPKIEWMINPNTLSGLLLCIHMETDKSKTYKYIKINNKFGSVFNIDNDGVSMVVSVIHIKPN